MHLELEEASASINLEFHGLYASFLFLALTPNHGIDFLFLSLNLMLNTFN